MSLAFATLLLQLAIGGVALAIVFITLALWRLRGAADRVVAVDALSACGIACCLIAAAVSGNTAFMDVAIGFTLIAFLATIGWSHAIAQPGSSGDRDDDGNARDDTVSDRQDEPGKEARA